MKNDFKNNSLFSSNEEEIDIKKILNIFLRNKSFIVFFTIFLFVFSSIYSLSKKKIWEGQFQILVKEKQNQGLQASILERSPLIQSISGKGSNLLTEVGILQSSSVLMPVFEFYKKERLELNPKTSSIETITRF